ncbi:cytochrome P450 [Artomyces pyxidatus]|uniref:Cytochrome P450 n=1 Tax=Artomyces pyxidatus TaxID=48021 RepID=A0ACB8SQ47_9AGAM|nr:cytochrome P450 [Artomyces pyxidatus]
MSPEFPGNGFRAFVDRLVPSTSILLQTIGVSLFLYTLHFGFRLGRFIVASINSPKRDIPGPPWKHWLTGSFGKGVWEPDALQDHERWMQEYGPIYKYYSMFSSTTIFLGDTKAVNHVLTRSHEFPKPEELRDALGEFLGQGLLFVEGPQHKQQRKVMGPAFGLPQIREFTNIFFQKSLEAQISHSGSHGRLEIDAFSWMNKVTLDIIGLAGFNYAFNSIRETKPHEMSEGIRVATDLNPFSLSFILPIIFPVAKIIPTKRDRAMKETLRLVSSIGTQVIADRKAEILASAEVDAKGGVEKRKIQGNDLLSLLVKANMASDIPESARLKDKDILAQVPTFLIAGHETTSTSLSWALVALSSAPAVRTKLAAEIRAHPSDTPTMEELNAIPYLDNVVREVLRLYAPVNNTERVADVDAVIPLSKPFLDKHGVLQHELRVKKRSRFLIPIRAINRSTELWGEDACQFRPERWDNLPESASSVPSVYSNMLTFIAGPHACIGYRFSVIETKAILFTFIRSFDFELAVNPEEIERKTVIVGRPVLASDREAGPQLPLYISPARRD